MSFLEDTLKSHESQNQKNINAAKRGNTSTLPKFSAKDSCLTPGQFDLPTIVEDWSHIDIHKRATRATGTGMDAFLNAVIKSV
jgi:hypothetical protein